TGSGSQSGANRPGVRHSEHVLVAMESREAEQSRDDARVELLLGLATGPARPPVDVGTVGIPGLDLVDREPLPVADVDLAQRAQFDRTEIEVVGADPRRLARAAEWTRVEGCERLSAKELGEPPRLLASRTVQRLVGVALDAALTVPVRLPVPDQDDRRRHAGYAS